MEGLNKVIEGLSYCCEDGRCPDCPYSEWRKDNECTGTLMSDALKLLREVAQKQATERLKERKK